MEREKIMRRVQSYSAMLKEVVKRLMKFFGYVMRKGDLEYLVTYRFVEGKRAEVDREKLAWPTSARECNRHQ